MNQLSGDSVDDVTIPGGCGRLQRQCNNFAAGYKKNNPHLFTISAHVDIDWRSKTGECLRGNQIFKTVTMDKRTQRRVLSPRRRRFIAFFQFLDKTENEAPQPLRKSKSVKSRTIIKEWHKIGSMPLLGAFISLCNILSYIHKNCEQFCVSFQEKYNRKLLVFKTVLN